MSQSNQILTCIVDGMRPDRPPAIRGAAARALINSLDFTRSNFEAQQERDVIMQVRVFTPCFFLRLLCSLVYDSSWLCA